MDSSIGSTTLGAGSTPVLVQPETLGRENFNLRSQLFRRHPKTFLPFQQRHMPPRAEEWIDNLGDALIPLTGDMESLGTMQVDWAMRTKSRGSYPMLHTLYYHRKAQSIWDPMPEEMLKGYLEVLASIPYGFDDIIAEYLPGIFDPIRAPFTDPPVPRRWYPKPILIAACIFAERRILNDPRTLAWGSDEDSDSGEGFQRDVRPGAYLSKTYGDQSDAESDIASICSILPDSDRSRNPWLEAVTSDSDSDSDRASTCFDWSDDDSDGASDCTEYSDRGPDIVKTSPDDRVEYPEVDEIPEEDENLEEVDDAAEDYEDFDVDQDSDLETWRVESIHLYFTQMEYELERRGLEMRPY